MPTDIAVVGYDDIELASYCHPPLTTIHQSIEVAGRALKGQYHNIRAYVAGPPPAVDAALRLLLLEGKVTADNIRYDKFS